MLFIILFWSSFTIQNSMDFIFFFDDSDKLLLRTEDKLGITFICNRYTRDQNPLIFVYSKIKSPKPDSLKNLNGLELESLKDLLSIEKEYYLKDLSKTNSKTNFLFPKWLEYQFKSFYVIEKSNNIFLKYRVKPAEMDIDYIDK